MQVESQAAQIQELRASYEQFQTLCQDADQRVRETQVTANAVIEQLRQQVQDATELGGIAQFKRTASNKEPGRAQPKEVGATNDAEMAVAALQHTISGGMRLRSPISAGKSQPKATKRRVTFFRCQTPENEMSEWGDRVPSFKEFSQKNKGKQRATELWSDDDEEV